MKYLRLFGNVKIRMIDKSVYYFESWLTVIMQIFFFFSFFSIVNILYCIVFTDIEEKQFMHRKGFKQS